LKSNDKIIELKSTKLITFNAIVRLNFFSIEQFRIEVDKHIKYREIKISFS